MDIITHLFKLNRLMQSIDNLFPRSNHHASDFNNDNILRYCCCIHLAIVIVGAYFLDMAMVVLVWGKHIRWRSNSYHYGQ